MNLSLRTLLVNRYTPWVNIKQVTFVAIAVLCENMINNINKIVTRTLPSNSRDNGTYGTPVVVKLCYQ